MTNQIRIDYLSHKSVEELLKAVQITEQVLSGKVKDDVEPTAPSGVALNHCGYALKLCEIDNGKEITQERPPSKLPSWTTRSTEKALELFHWLCDNRCTVQENSVIGNPQWFVSDVDNEILGSGATPEDAIQDTVGRMHNGQTGLCEARKPSLGKYVPRRFKVIRDKTPMIKCDRSEYYHYGTYFPLNDQTALDTGKWRTGKPKGEVEWIDQPPT